VVHGLFVPWTIRTLDYSYHRWTIHTLDCSYPPGLFVPWTVRTVLGLFVPWTVRTMDCSYPLGLFVPWTIRTFLDCSYLGLFIPSLDFSYPVLFVPWTVRTPLDCSYHGLFVPSLDDSYHVARLTKINVESTPLNFSDIFPKRLGLLVQILLAYYTFLSTQDYKCFIKLSATLTKLCHIKRDHHHMLEIFTIGRNARWVVALNMA